MAKAKETREETRQGEQRTQVQGIARRSSYGLSPWTGSPFSFMRRFSEEMDRLFGDFGFGSSWLTPNISDFGRGLLPHGEFGVATWAPEIEMFQRGDQLVLRADLPGLTKDDIKVDVQDNCITIQGERRQEREEGREGEGRYRSERRYGSFYRCIELPEGVNADNANATFRNGVLEVTMPAPQQTQGRRIEIQS